MGSKIGIRKEFCKDLKRQRSDEGDYKMMGS